MLGLLLRLYRVGAYELWLDESFSFRDITVRDWLHDLRWKDIPPLYPLLLRGWTTLAGDSEAGIRLLSVLLSTLSVAATIWLGNELFNRRAALWSGVFAATAPIGVYYAQEARVYALLTALITCTYALTARALRADTARAWALVTLASGAVLHTHFLGGLALAPTALMPIARPGSGTGRRYALAMALGGLLFVPWFVWSFVLTSHPVQGIDWIRNAWDQTPPMLAIPKALETLYLGSQAGALPITLKQFDTLAYPEALRLLGLGALALVGICIALPWGNPWTEIPWAGRRVAVLWALLLFPPVVLWAVSWAKPLYLVGRYDQLAFPALPLLLGGGIAKLRALPRYGSSAAMLAALALLVPVSAKLFLYHTEPVRERAQSRNTARALVNTVLPDDVVVFADLRGYPLIYQLHRLGYEFQDGICGDAASGRRFQCRMFPRQIGPLPHQADWDRVTNAGDVVRSDLLEYIAGARRPDPTVHVVLGSFSIAGSNVSVPALDGLLLKELGALGYSLASFDPHLGVAEYHRIRK